MKRKKTTALYEVPENKLRLILKVEIDDVDDSYCVRINGGTKGDEAIQAIACVIRDIAARERTFAPGYTSATIMRSVEQWLKILEEER